MASDNDGPRRDGDRPEDNPFIAFRRFADSQVSSLLNTVFSLPATLSSFNNAHHAREQCLFGHADARKCKDLAEIEEKVARIRSEGRELYRVGDLQQVLTKGEELMKLDRQANEIRKEIVDETRIKDVEQGTSHADIDLVERVANEKGQQWAWSWSWGYPKPFDEETSLGTGEKCPRRLGLLDELFEGMERSMPQWEAPSRQSGQEPRPSSHGHMGRHHWTEDEIDRALRARSLLSLPPQYTIKELEADPQLSRAGVPWGNAFEDLYRATLHAPLMPSHHPGQPKDTPYRARQPSEDSPNEEANDEPSYEYSHDHEDQHDEPPSPRASRQTFGHGQPATELDAYEQFLSPKKSPVDPANAANSSILSTLTTTERTVALDGTVTTKVVLKKRFADGREESSETVHTQRGQDGDVQSQDPWKTLQKSQAQDENKRGGWFWSN